MKLRDCQRLIEKYIPILRLQDWDIKVEWGDLGEDDHATITWDESCKKAIITINRKQPEDELGFEPEFIILHELFHIAIPQSFAPVLTGKKREQLGNYIDAVCDRCARIILGL
jgi:hypothetical protein